MKSGDLFKLAVSIVACQLAGIIGSLFTARSVATWYAGLTRPGFTPPDSVFAPVWITLYVLMGLSAFLIWRRGIDRVDVKRGLVLFLVQLVLNTVWSIAFFGARSPFAGLIVIVALWVAILMTMTVFLRVSKLSGILLVPYLVWVSFAGVLNASIWILNR